MCIIKLTSRQKLGFEIPSIWHYHTSQLGCVQAWRKHKIFDFFPPTGHFAFSSARHPLGIAWISSTPSRDFTLDSSTTVSLVRYTLYWLSSHHSMESSCCFCKRTVLVPVQGAVGLLVTGKSELPPLASLWSWLWGFRPFIHCCKAVPYLEVHINLCSWVTQAEKPSLSYSVLLPKMCVSEPSQSHQPSSHIGFLLCF